MSNCFKKIALFCSLAITGTAFAESASDNLTRIEAETMVLKAREKQLDVQAKIIAKQSEIASKQAESERLTQTAAAGTPSIVSIEGLGKTMFATLQMENGNTVDVQAGDRLSNGMKVVSIRPNEVIIEIGKKKHIRLATALHTPPVFDPSYPSAGLRLPPLAPPSASIMLKGTAK